MREAELVLLCVKTLDTEESAIAVAPHLAPAALVISLQNGVDNVERIRAAADLDALPAVVYVSAEMSAPGAVKHNGRGDLVIGELPGAGHAPRAAAGTHRANLLPGRRSPAAFRTTSRPSCGRS